MSLDEQQHAGEARKAADELGEQGAAKRSRVEEKVERKQRKTPNYPIGFGDCKDKMMIFEPVITRFVEVEKCSIRLTEQQMHEPSLRCTVEFKTEQGSAVSVEFRTDYSDRIEMSLKSDKVGANQFYSRAFRLLNVSDFGDIAEWTTTHFELVCYVAVANHYFADMNDLTSRWAVSCLFDELPQYAKPVRVLVKGLRLAEIRAYEVEYHAPLMARLMRGRMDREPSAESVAFDLGDEVSLDAARVFLEILTSGRYGDWCEHLSVVQIQQVVQLAQTWLVSDHPSARSTHTPLYEAVLDEVYDHARDIDDVEDRLGLLKIAVVASKNGGVPHLLAFMTDVMQGALVYRFACKK
jgi:hypothetical protein